MKLTLALVSIFPSCEEREELQALKGQEWALISINDQEIEQGLVKPALIFNSESKFSGSCCNHYFGQYRISYQNNTTKG